MKVKTKLKIAFLFPIFVVATILTTVLFVDENFREGEETFLLVNQLNREAFELCVVSQEFARYTQPHAMRKLQAKYTLLRQKLQQPALDKFQPIRDKISLHLEGINRIFLQFLECVEKEKSASPKQKLFLKEWQNVLENKLMVLSHTLVRDTQKLMQAERTSVAQSQNLARSFLIGLIFFSLAFLTGVLFPLTRGISESIEQLIQGTRLIAKGNWSYRMNIPYNDETGMLAQAFNSMAESLSKSYRALRETNLSLERGIQRHKDDQAKISLLNAELENRVKKRTAQLEAINKELESFSYSVSHDLRAPLRHIQGFLQLLEQRAKGQLDEEAQKYLDRISSSAENMNKLIDAILDLSRNSRKKLQKTPVNTEKIVREVLADVKVPENAQITIRALPNSYADAGTIRVVWLNLITNALKFSSHNPAPQIIIGHLDMDPKNNNTFYVKDNGVGFEMKYIDKVFGVFQRLHSPDEFEGTGIGMANVWRIIQRHEGKIWAYSEVGKGATFYFTLPKKNSADTNKHPTLDVKLDKQSQDKLVWAHNIAINNR